jgi:hypothetical protein
LAASGRTDETADEYLDWWVNTERSFVDKRRKNDETIKDSKTPSTASRQSAGEHQASMWS